jgi:ketosteroid isomerase-like protein
VGSVNVDLVRSIYAAWESGDFSSAGWADPDFEYVHADGPSPGTFKGVAGMADAWRDWLRAWEEFRVEVDEYRELDDERVLLLIRRSGRGRTSGLDLGQLRTQGAALFHVRDGKVTRLINYWDRERALAELGLVPEPGEPA